ncbi:hypothetical protein [Aerosakkonema funiforme]|uniref:Uncharacterized protein n=2 Tax=Oscillatoriophycideae TaxID=1301283 RepID=A0A926VHP6_9CYAN|nr:hypothetical protein [Aerosakkonema funiforme]MBD2183943.1 hypothetical protein [Aerosakkonema funiforme FACHB-1375]
MEKLSKLLEINHSELARLVRFYLHGLQGGLQVALTELPEDPGANLAKEVLGELEGILRSPTSTPIENISHSLEDIFEPVTSNYSSKLSGIKHNFETDKELRFYLGDFQLLSNNDADLWQEMQLKLLRVPETLAESWREKLPDFSNQRSPIQLPFTRDEHIYPGLEFSTKTKLDVRVAVETSDSDVYFLATVLSTYIKFIEAIDPDLHHAFKPVNRFGVKSLATKDEKSKYIAALIDCFQRAKTAAKNIDPADNLRARIDLDEAINSLVYQPPVDRDSWWGKLQQEARRTLKKAAESARKAGHTVQIRELWGAYADIRAYSKDDLELDSGGRSGEVLACLRVYAKIDDEVLPGRVLYRSFFQS